MATGRKALPGCRHCWAEAQTPPRYPRRAPAGHRGRAGGYGRARRDPCAPLPCALHTPGQARRGSGDDRAIVHDGDPWALPRAFVPSPGRKHRDRIRHGTAPSCTPSEPHASASVPSCPPARRLPPARPDRCIAAAAATAPPHTMAILGRLPRAFVPSPGRKHRDRIHNGMVPSRTRGDPHASASVPSCPPACRLPPAHPDRCITAAVAIAPPRTMAILGPCLVPSSPAPDGSTATASATGRRHRARPANLMLRHQCHPVLPHAAFLQHARTGASRQRRRLRHRARWRSLGACLVPSSTAPEGSTDRIRNGTVPSRTWGDPHASASAPSSRTPPSSRKPGYAVARPWQQRRADGTVGPYRLPVDAPARSSGRVQAHHRADVSGQSPRGAPERLPRRGHDPPRRSEGQWRVFPATDRCRP